jgi:hypothetical protein
MRRSGSLLFAFGVAVAAAQSPDTFTPVANLTVPREFHTSTLLPNGTVLIAGGFSYGNGPFSTWDTAEIYDPVRATFVSTGRMIAARQMHTATLLPNGTVLIAGGSVGNGGPGQASAEVYDPATGTFAATGSMTVPRAQQIATLLNSGKVLIAGGSSSLTAELYDPSTRTFSATGGLTEPGFVDTATLLADGRVLLTRSISDYAEDHADLYDPTTGSFTRTGDLVETTAPGTYLGFAKPGQQPTATLMPSGKVLIAGGSWGDLGSSTVAEVYDPVTGDFSLTGKMTAGIGAAAAATLLPEGRVLIAGRDYGVQCAPVIGQPQLGTCPGSAELYDPAAGAFGPRVSSQSEEGHRGTLLLDGTVLLTGGFRCCGFSIDSAELYHAALQVPPAALLWTSGNGQGLGAVQHADTYQLVTSDNPAVSGEIVVVYCTGLADGSVIPPQLAIGGKMAEVLWFGNSPGFPGLNQMNVRMPDGVAPGAAVPLRMNYIGRPSNTVTIAVK